MQSHKVLRFNMPVCFLVLLKICKAHYEHAADEQLFLYIIIKDKMQTELLLHYNSPMCLPAEGDQLT